MLRLLTLVAALAAASSVPDLQGGGRKVACAGKGALTPEQGKRRIQCCSGCPRTRCCHAWLQQHRQLHPVSSKQAEENRRQPPQRISSWLSCMPHNACIECCHCV
jgi:hypothetical protein